MKKIVCVFVFISLITCIGILYLANISKSNDDLKSNESEKNIKKDPIGRMIKINGILYYETDDTPYNGPRCGNYDGLISSTVLEGEIPIENNQSNFGVNYGFQYTGNLDTVEVFIENEIIVFSKIG